MYRFVSELNACSVEDLMIQILLFEPRVFCGLFISGLK